LEAPSKHTQLPKASTDNRILYQGTPQLGGRQITESWLEFKKRERTTLIAHQTQQRNRVNEDVRRSLAQFRALDPALLPEEIEKAKATLQRIAEERTHLAKLAARISWDTQVELPSRYLTARIKARETERLVVAIKCPSTGVRGDRGDDTRRPYRVPSLTLGPLLAFYYILLYMLKS